MLRFSYKGFPQSVNARLKKLGNDDFNLELLERTIEDNESNNIKVLCISARDILRIIDQQQHDFPKICTVSDKLKRYGHRFIIRGDGTINLATQCTEDLKLALINLTKLSEFLFLFENITNKIQSDLSLIIKLKQYFLYLSLKYDQDYLLASYYL